MNPTKTGVELRCSGRGKKSLKIPKELSFLITYTRIVIFLI
jgi:hypothetical protein